MSGLRKLLRINESQLNEINKFILDENNQIINDVIKVVEKYGGPDKINQKAKEAQNFDTIIGRLKEIKSQYISDLEWLINQRDAGSFIKMSEYREKVIGSRASTLDFNERNAVTLEISALNFFPWLIAEAKQAIEKKELMPGRYIRVRNMKEQLKDNGDLLAFSAAMQIIGASYVQTLDTKGTDGSNIHLGGGETITGYFGGIGQPNEYALKWVDEYLYYFTNYGIAQVLNINAGTIFLAFLLHKLGINNSFKISVYLGIDNPYSLFWTLMMAKLFARDNNTTSLVGLNFSNSVNNETILRSDNIREAFGFGDMVRFEHHITETYKSIVRQPYNRRQELIDLAKDVKNISAKHEGGDVEIEESCEHPSDILEYFLTKEEIEEKNLMKSLERNYLDKHNALNKTAESLTKAGICVIPAKNLHLNKF